MRRLLVLVLCFLLISPVFAEDNVETPLYRARTSKDVNIRAEADSSSRFIAKVSRGESVLVYEYGEKWCRVSYGDKYGWTRTDGLYAYWALTDAPLPNMVFNSGVAILTQNVHVEHADKSDGDLFTGTDLMPGMRIGAISDDGVIPFRRHTETLPEGAFTFMPFVPAEAALPGDLIYAFTTYYNEAVGGDLAEGRQHNIALAAERLNGCIVGSGEQFSYNAVCGPYTKQNGYVKAPNISRSGVGVGGGVCQLSTTLFQAILGIDVQLDEWNVHRVSGVWYAPLNFDCAVGNTTSDLCFTNTWPWPLRIEALTQGGALTVLLYRAE